LELGGFAWEKAGQIWYVTLKDKLSASSNFQQAADLSFQAAGELFGNGSLEQNAVKKGWAEVGIVVGGTSTGGTGCLATPVTLIRSIFQPKQAKEGSNAN